MKRKLRCKNCLVTNTCENTEVDENNICNHCNDLKNGNKSKTKHLLSKDEKQKYVNDLDNILKNIKGKKDYDCVVGFSGGKDSMYLVYKLKKDYPNLRILAVTVTVGYVFNKNAENNLSEILAKLDVDHVTIKPRADFYKKLFTYLLNNRIPGGYKKGSYDSEVISKENSSVCVYCHGIIHDILLNYAAQNEIPLQITGASPAQPLYWFYKQDEEELSKPNIPYFMNEEPFNERDRLYCWDPNRYPNLEKLPIALFPFHVWDYDSEKIRKIIYDVGLISSYKSSSMLRTNCLLNQLMSYVDLRIDGNFNMLPYIGFLIRNGFSDKKKWKSTVFLVEKILLRSKNPSIKKLEKDFGINVDDLIEKFKHQKLKQNNR